MLFLPRSRAQAGDAPVIFLGNSTAPVVRHQKDVLSPWQPPTVTSDSLPACDAEKFKIFLV